MTSREESVRSAEQDDYAYTVADVMYNRDETTRGAFEAGVRQAMTWLRADYEYGTGPEWREHGCEWIAERLAEWRMSLPPESRTGGES